MKILLAILLIIGPITDLDKVARVNKAKKEAAQAYKQGNYELAKEKYAFLKDSLQVNDESMVLDLAHCQYLLKDSVGARQNYKALTGSTNPEIRSIAEQQLGAMQFKGKKYKEALQHYKSALKANPANEDARYNYELLKKILKEQEEQQQQQQNKDQQNKDQEKKDQQNKDQQDQQQQNQQQKEQEQKEQEQKEQEQKEQKQQDQEKEQQEKEKQQQEEQKAEEQQQKEKQDKPEPIDQEKLKEMKISEEKAKLILEAMKNNEIQYIQQNKRKAKKKKDPTKPDW